MALLTFAPAMPPMARFALVTALIVGIPPLARRVRLPPLVGLLLSGMLVGPHCLDLIGAQRPVVDFLAQLGILLLMFFAGLEIDLDLFQRTRNRSLFFGLVTTAIPQILGTSVGLMFGYQPISAIVLGSLLASHTLLALPIVTKFGIVRLEPVTITVGATVLSDTLSLIVFAVCAATYQRGFSVPGISIQLTEIAVFVPLILFGVGRFGRFLLKKVESDQSTYFVLMLSVMALATFLADCIDLPGIVGAFLAGLAVNAAVQHEPAEETLEFVGNSLFIPTFFVVTGSLIDPRAFMRSLADHFTLVLAIVGALIVGKWLAAQVVGWSFKYSPAARRVMWSLTLPQVAATLAAALVAYQTLDRTGRRLVDGTLLDAVLVLMLATSTLGPILTERFAPRLTKEEPLTSLGPVHAISPR